MRIEEIEQAKKLITESKVLSSLEKTEWLQLLPQMNDRQIIELNKILVDALNPKPAGGNSAWPPWELQVDPKQKELTTSKPEFELEIPEHATAPKPPQPPIKPQPPKQQPTLQQLVARVEKTAVSEPPKKPLGPVQPPKPTAPMHLSQMPKVDRPKPPKPAEPVIEKPKEVHLLKPEDFKNLTPSVVHGQDPVETFQDLLNAIIAVSQKYKTLNILASLEQSPLYKAYVNTGIVLLGGKEMLKADNEHLTKEEFEAFTDFRSELTKLHL